MGISIWNNALPANLYWDATNKWLGVNRTGLAPITLKNENADKIRLFGSASATYSSGFGINASELQTYAPTAARFTWNKGGDFQTSGTNEVMRLDNTLGALILGGAGAAPAATAILELKSTTKALLLPRLTTAQKNALATPAAGMLIYDTDLAKLCVYTGAAWETVTSA